MPPDILAAAEAAPANRAVVGVLRKRAVRRPPDDPWALDGFELHTHPDLQERLDHVAAGRPGGHSVGLYGVPVLIAADVVYAIAGGTSRVYLRIPAGPTRDEVERHGGDADVDFGPEWVGADAWLSDLPSAAGTRLLASWVAAAARAARDA
jgi:hypothetical protein